MALSAGALLLAGSAAPSAPAAAAGTRSGTLHVVTRAGTLDGTYSISDVVTGTSARVARMKFVFDPHGQTLDLMSGTAGGRSSICVEKSNGDYCDHAYLVQDSNTEAHADVYLDASDPATTYEAYVALRFSLGGRTGFWFYDPDPLEFKVKRQTKARVTAERSGSSVVVSGGLSRAVPLLRQTEVGFRPYPGADVVLTFDPEGDAPAVSKATVTTSAAGTFSRKLAYPGPGRWIAAFAGNSAYAPSGVLASGRPAPAPEPAKTVRYTDYGVTASLKTVATNVTVTGSDEVKMRVDIRGSADTDWLSIEAREICAVSRVGRYDWRCSTARKVSSNHAYAVFPFSSFDPASVYDLAVAGKFTLSGWGKIDFPASSGVASFKVSKKTRLTTALSDTSARTGQKVWVSGSLKVPTLKSDSTNPSGFHALPYEPVRIWFDPSGSADPVLKAKITTDSKGAYAKSFTARTSGSWIVRYAGDETQFLTSSSDRKWMSAG
ncbi:hypothetical protein [Myceligenerans crystallogenes]|uniref:hypothetical protein n=1 Tax=Myceligenerans crystallogenes TaxID=316335 RepID=UPI0031D77177